MGEAALKQWLASAVVFEWLANEEVGLKCKGGTTRGGCEGAVRQSAQAVEMQMADADGRCRWLMQMRSTAVHSTA